jgi:hypothetical protein
MAYAGFRITAILGLIDLMSHHLTYSWRGQGIVFTDAEVEQLTLGVIAQCLPLGAFDLLELIDLCVFTIVRTADALGEELLEVGIGSTGVSR